MENSEETTPRKTLDANNHSDNHGLTYYQCQGKYGGSKKCTVCTIKDQCNTESKKWW